VSTAVLRWELPLHFSLRSSHNNFAPVRRDDHTLDNVDILASKLLVSVDAQSSWQAWPRLNCEQASAWGAVKQSTLKSMPNIEVLEH
jgi:hypothetical protein